MKAILFVIALSIYTQYLQYCDINGTRLFLSRNIDFS